MYTIPELRLNLYQDVRIPSAKDLYEKLGMRSVASAGSVGKDGDFAEPVNVSTDKITDRERLRTGGVEVITVAERMGITKQIREKINQFYTVSIRCTIEIGRYIGKVRIAKNIVIQRYTIK